MKQMKLALLCLLILPGLSVMAQDKFLTKNGDVSFYSEAPLENIEAMNRQVVGVIDIQKNEVAVTMLMKAFEFEKALMQEHFNENYVESDKFPKASFKGKFTASDAIDPNSNTLYEVDITGDLTIHGVTKNINAKGSVEFKGGQLLAKSTFKVAVKDFEIEIPKVVNQNIAEEIEVKVDLACNSYNN